MEFEKGEKNLFYGKDFGKELSLVPKKTYKKTFLLKKYIASESFLLLIFLYFPAHLKIKYLFVNPS